MKKILCFFFLNVACNFCFAQDNPYAVFGYKSNVEYKDSKDDIYWVRNNNPNSNIKAMEFDFTNHVVKLFNQKDSLVENINIKDDKVLRFLSIDPYTTKYPQLTPYQFASNTPIQAVDVDGLERFYYAISYNKNDRAYITPVRKEDIIDHSIHLTADFPFVKIVEEVNKRQEFVVQGTTTRTWDNFGNTTFYQDEDQLTFSTLNEAKKHVEKNNGLGYVYSFSHQLGQAARYQAEEEIGGSGVLGEVSSPGVPNVPAQTTTEPNEFTPTGSSGKFGGKTVIVDENLSPLLSEGLRAAGYNVKIFDKGTQDDEIIDWAKSNEAIVITNNEKDFLKKGVTILKVSENMKRQTAVGNVVKAVNNVDQASKADPNLLKPGAKVNLTQYP